MHLQIGLFVYLLLKFCGSLGAVAYPIDDKLDRIRIISVCTDYGQEQAYQEFVHEVAHACIHNHDHNFKTKAELDKHLSMIEIQSEEAFVSNLAACMVPVLENVDASEFLRSK